jgi:hypothetical protein
LAAFFGLLTVTHETINHTVEPNAPDLISWRLDHDLHGTDEDVDPALTGAKITFDTIQSFRK